MQPGPLPNVQTDVLRWYEATYDTFSEDLKYTAKMARDFVARKAVGGLAVQDACTGELCAFHCTTANKHSVIIVVGAHQNL